VNSLTQTVSVQVIFLANSYLSEEQKGCHKVVMSTCVSLVCYALRYVCAVDLLLMIYCNEQNIFRKLSVDKNQQCATSIVQSFQLVQVTVH